MLELGLKLLLILLLAPMDNHYVWKATKKRNWFGPTKAEVSLVWLLGGGYGNEKKNSKIK